MCEHGVVRLAVSRFDRALPLVIDPVIDFSALLGGSGTNGATSVALDSSGNIYVTGSTDSSDFLDTGKLPSDPYMNKPDIFVTKFDPLGKTILYSAVVGGSDVDTASGIAVDGAGNAYVIGQTQSTDFPDATCVGSKPLGGVPLIFKLNASGTALAYSNCFSTNPTATANGIALDDSGNVYVTGKVTGAFPTTPGSAQPSPAPVASGYGSPSTGFVVKMNSSAHFVYSTYIGGSKNTSANAVAVDGSGSAYIAGTTESTDFPVTPGVFQGVLASMFGGNAFATKLKADGSAFLYSTYLGGQGRNDSGNAITVDASGNAYLTGSANVGAGPQSNLPFPTTPGVMFPTCDLFCGFLTELNPDASGLVFSTYLPRGSPSLRLTDTR